jgi:hypothetical protein
MRIPAAVGLQLALLFASSAVSASGGAPSSVDARELSGISDEARHAIAERVAEIESRFRASHGGAAPEQFGLQCCQILQIPASAFQPYSAGEVWTAADYGYIYPVAFGTELRDLWAPVSLPTGAYLTFGNFYYYDADEAGFLDCYLRGYSGGGFSSGAPANVDGLGGFTTSGSLGYGYGSFAIDHTVNNNVGYDPAAAQLAVHVDVTNLTPNLQFKAVDLWWMRQVGPPPATARFNDVPTSHPFFQFVEALAASGITAGCNAAPPLFCPDAPLTRGQMAVFLSKALGLYWQW